MLCMWVAGIPAPQQTGRQGPRPASIPVLLNRAGASSPRGQGALPYLCDWEHGAGGWENTKNCNREGKRRRTESQQDEERNKRKKRRADEPDPEKNHRAVRIANLGIFRRCNTKPHWYPCCRRATLLGGGADMDSHTCPQSSWSDKRLEKKTWAQRRKEEWTGKVCYDVLREPEAIFRGKGYDHKLKPFL